MISTCRKLLEAIRKCQCKKQNKVSDSLNEEDLWEPDDVNQYINYQLNCTPLQDFTIDEYMEKVIQYGFLMLFAASFPLAPLVAFLTNLCDRYVDAKRLLWMYRRPVPFMVHTIGIWEPIVELVNAAGVISNACLIAFTSNWGKNYSFTDKLIIVISVEHAVFFLKFFLAAVIPDVPADVSLNIRREKFQIEKLLDSDIGNANDESLDPGAITSIPVYQPPSVENNSNTPRLSKGYDLLQPISTETEPKKKKKRRKEKRKRKSLSETDDQTSTVNKSTEGHDNYDFNGNANETVADIRV